MNKKFIGFILLVSSFIASNAWAVPIVSGYTGGSQFGSYYGSAAGDVVGFAFTADIDLTVTDFGILNDPDDGVLDSAHMVGLWDAVTETLLGSLSVDSSGTLIDGFYYASLGSTIQLIAGMEYVLGAVYTLSDSDSYISTPTTIDLVNISMTNGVFPELDELGFAFPSENSSNLARLGPNMLANPTSVSAPGSILLLGLGLLGFARVSRKP